LRKALSGSPRGALSGAIALGRFYQLAYVPLLTVAMAMMFLRVVSMARLLNIHEFGHYSELLLISGTFCMLACLGLQPMLQRDMPVMLVRNRERAAAVAVAQCVIVACACFLFLTLVSVFAGRLTGGVDRDLIALGLLHGLSQQLFLIVTVESRSRGQSIRYAMQNLMRGGLILGGSILLAAYTKSAILVVVGEAALSIAVASTIMLRTYRPGGLRASAAFKTAVRRLPRARWSSALALLVVAMISFAVLNADRWVAAETFKPEGFSQYAFAWTLLTIAQSIQLVINASAFPFLARTFATSGVAPTYRLCMTMSCTLLICSIAMSFPIWMLCRFGVSRWFSAYKASLILVPLFIAAAGLRIADFWSSFIVIIGYEARLILANLTAIILSLGLWAVWVRPWVSANIGLWQIGLLAALFSACNYLFVMGAAWYARRP
jgi:O-antigen/teichoic acid export membrane protein